MVTQVQNFVEMCVIYRSEDERGMWVAHSINTDQIGMGRGILEAFVALKKALKAVIEEYNENPSTPLFTPAPAEIREKLKHSRPLPQALQDRAEELIARNKKTPPPYGGQFKSLRTDMPMETLLA
jgi:hypothetical protein